MPRPKLIQVLVLGVWVLFDGFAKFVISCQVLDLSNVSEARKWWVHWKKISLLCWYEITNLYC